MKKTVLNKRMVFYCAGRYPARQCWRWRSFWLAWLRRQIRGADLFQQASGGAVSRRTWENLTARHFHGLLEMFTGSKPPVDPRV